MIKLTIVTAKITFSKSKPTFGWVEFPNRLKDIVCIMIGASSFIEKTRTAPGFFILRGTDKRKKAEQGTDQNVGSLFSIFISL